MDDLEATAAPKPTHPTATLVTVTYNNRKQLEYYWRGVAEMGVDWVVVDNASTDGSADVAESLGARVIRLSENVGFSAANNIGVADSPGKVLIFCNPDVRVTADGVRALAAKATASGGLVAPQLANRDGSLQENGRGTPFPHRKLRHMFGRHDRQDAYVRWAHAGEFTQVVWVMGAAVAMARSTFDRIGGWDSGYFIYYEDADICIRALKLGIPTFVDGDTKWQHGWARETRGRFSGAAWRHEMKSAARFYRQHLYCIVPSGSTAALLRTVDSRNR